MQYFINKKTIKQSVKNLSFFLKENGFNLPYNIILEGFSKSIFFKNWSTLEGAISKPDLIKYFPEKKSYMIEIDCSMSANDLLKLLKESFVQGKCEASIDAFLGKENSFHIEISFPNKNDNFLTSIFILANSLKKHNVKRFDLLRIVFEKENLLPSLDLNFSKKHTKLY